MSENSASNQVTQTRVRAFVDYWNFQLTLNGREAQDRQVDDYRFSVDWGTVDQSADRMKELLLKQLAESQPYNPVEWNNSREAWEGSLERIADELVLEDRVLVPMPEPDGEGP